MNLEPSPEQLALRDSVRAMLAAVPQHDAPTATTDAIRKGCIELGVPGLLVPQRYGGAEATMADAGVVVAEFGRAPTPGPWLSTVIAAPRACARFGVTDDAADLLTGLADGSIIATVAAQPVTATVIDASPERGERVRLDGCAAAVPDVDVADVVLVAVRDGAVASLLAVESAAIRANITPLPTAGGIRPHWRIDFAASPARRLATAPATAVAALVDDMLIGGASEAWGAAQRIFELAVEHAGTRSQFGRPVGAFQAVAHLCVDMFETVELAHGGVVHGWWAADAGSAEQRHLAALRAKAFAGRLAAVGDTAVQVFGGIGFTRDHPAHLYLERLLSWSAFLGDPDGHLREIGSHLVRDAHMRRRTP